MDSERLASGVGAQQSGAPAKPRRGPARPPLERTLRRFRLVCVVRVLALCATLLPLFHLLYAREHPAAILMVGLVVVYQVWALMHYVDRTNRDLTRFLLAIRHSDFSQSFAGSGLGPAFDGLKVAFNDVLDAFRETRATSEEQARYLQTVVQHVGMGLLAYDSGGGVHLLNTAAKRLLRVSRLRNIAELEEFSPELVTALRDLASQHKALVRIHEPNEVQQLALYGTVFRLREHEYTLASLQNIQAELEDKEMEAWQNLVRVLTHEIMNSITPISSLAATAHQLLETDPLPDDAVPDVREAVETIHRRSDGLLHFVEAYRSLTRLPAPVFQILSVAQLFARMQQLMDQQMSAAGAGLSVHVEPPQLELTADPELLEQALINLLRNAADAVKERDQAHVALRAKSDGRGRVLVEVIDNGHGIVQEAQDKIFIPFFTTKQGGSGIGLSLCREIMRLHRGTITVRSEPDSETTFALRF